jgi:hypothetical protein
MKQSHPINRLHPGNGNRGGNTNRQKGKDCRGGQALHLEKMGFNIEKRGGSVVYELKMIFGEK